MSLGLTQVWVRRKYGSDASMGQTQVQVEQETGSDTSVFQESLGKA